MEDGLELWNAGVVGDNEWRSVVMSFLFRL